MINVVVDLYHGDGHVDFAQAKADEIEGIIHKATQGHHPDPEYAGRKPLALQAGLMWGAYHFGNGEDAHDQAKRFLDVVQPDDKTLLVLDFEPNPHGTTMSLAQARTFVSYVANARGGYWPGLYGGGYLKEQLGQNDDPILSRCWLWLAQYGPHAVIPPAWPMWTMWQYTDGALGPQPHTVHGIGRCDRNFFNGDLTQLRQLWGY